MARRVSFTISMLTMRRLTRVCRRLPNALSFCAKLRFPKASYLNPEALYSHSDSAAPWGRNGAAGQCLLRGRYSQRLNFDLISA